MSGRMMMRSLAGVFLLMFVFTGAAAGRSLNISARMEF